MRFSLLSLLALVSVAISTPAAFAGDQDFVLINQTGVELSEIYVSASNKDNWEEDILGENTLADGDKLNVHFSSEEDAKVWDIKVVGAQGGDITWQGINLMKTGKVTLHYDDDSNEATASLE